MEAYTALVPVRVGDVVAVERNIPHSLQHGVRVVEFQTPVYERLIIAFAQKVLTQDHWDSEEAIARMSLSSSPCPLFQVIGEADALKVERIASFNDFSVWRATLGPAGSLQLPTELPYALCFVVEGRARVAHLDLGPEEACFVPGSAVQAIAIASDHGALCLLVAPGL